MSILTRIAVSGIAALMLFSQVRFTTAAEIKVLCANAMRPAMKDLGPKFEHASGHKLAITFGTVGKMVKRVQGGESADVVIAPKQGMDALGKDGKLIAESAILIARSSTGIAVRRGAPKPDISTPEALKRSLLAANSFTYGNPAQGGASGIHVAKVLDRLGIASEMKGKTVFAKNIAQAVALVEEGRVELVAAQTGDLATKPGLEIVGLLPGDLRNNIDFLAAIMTGARDVAAARALIDFLRADEAAAVIKAKGLQPG